MPLPILPHEVFGAVDCCGCLMEEILDDGPRFTCNECGEAVPVQDVQRAVLEMESTDETCPHCGQVNHIEGFSEVFAFVCRHCGKSAGI